MSVPLFTELGGLSMTSTAIVLFHRKAMHDKRVSYLFQDSDEDRAIRKEQALLSFAFDNPQEDYRISVNEAQRDLLEDGLDDSHLDAMVDLLDATLHDMGMPGDLIADAVASAESKREDFLCGDWLAKAQA